MAAEVERKRGWPGVRGEAVDDKREAESVPVCWGEGQVDIAGSARAGLREGRKRSEGGANRGIRWDFDKAPGVGVGRRGSDCCRITSRRNVSLPPTSG